MGLFKNRNPAEEATTPSLTGDAYKKTFKQDRYASGSTESFVDASDSYANLLDMAISFEHLPTGQSLYFKAFVTAYNETYSPDWGQESVYGRGDPIYQFKSTTRRITLAFKVPAASMSEAYENLGKVQRLIQFLYPYYMQKDDVATLAQSPFIRLKVMNLLQTTKTKYEGAFIDVDTRNADDWAKQKYNDYKSTNEADQGLLGCIMSLSVNHNIENPDIGVLEKAKNTVLPKMIEINMEFAPIHEHALGWDADAIFGRTDFTKQSSPVGRAFPYGVSLYDPNMASHLAANTAVAIGATTDREALNELGDDDADLSAAETAPVEGPNSATTEELIAAYREVLVGLGDIHDPDAPNVSRELEATHGVNAEGMMTLSFGDDPFKD